MTTSAAGMREALERLADAADAVGVQFFDTDTMAPEVEEMQAATQAARAALSTKQEGEEASRDAATMEWASRAAAEVKAAGPQPTRPVSEFIAEQRAGWRDMESAPKDGTPGWYSEETAELPDPVGWMPLPTPLAAPAIAAIVETYTDILSPETARKVASRIRAIPGGMECGADDALEEALGLADTIINRLPANGEHWSLIQRYGAARSAMEAALKSDEEQEG